MNKRSASNKSVLTRTITAVMLLLLLMGSACSDYGDSPPVEIVLPMLTIDDVMGTESDTLWFTVRLSSLSSVDVTFEYATADSTALASEGDYAPIQSGLGLIPAGSDSCMIAVVCTDDAFIELPELFYLLLSLPTNAAIATSYATGTIIDDDGQPRLSIRDASASEGDTLFFIVFLSPVGPRDISFFYSTAVSASGDYVAVTGKTAMISAGNATVILPVVTSEDTEYEMDELVLICLDSARNADIVDSVAVGSIFDNDMVSFENIIRPILAGTASCNDAACHRGKVALGGLNIGDASYDSVRFASGLSEISLVVPYDAPASSLYQRIITNNLIERMPPPPDAALSDENIRQIRDWINQGAPDN